MEKFTTLTAVAAPLVRDNIDTDVIIPSREMTSAAPEVLADGLFAGWRYRQVGSREPDPGFVLNQPEYQNARILIAGANFGCGSSREHAVWALRGYGFRAVLAPGFSPIFFNNCVRNGVAPVVLPTAAIEVLASLVASDPRGQPLTVDLHDLRVSAPSGDRFGFRLDGHARYMLMSGLDEIDITLAMQDQIDAFLERDRALRPWIYEYE